MQSLAIIGTGISGMGAAYFLRDHFDITLYEKNNYVGGHTHTLTVVEDKHQVFIDTAFMVYNETTYPLLTRLFKELDVKTKATNMSFSVQYVPDGLEFCGSGYNGLFAQRRNMWNRPYLRMLLEVERFNKEASEVLEGTYYQNYSLAQYAKEKKYSQDFLDQFLVPMSSAVWSTPADAMLTFPVITLVRFFKNHGFLDLKKQLTWRTCVDGSRQYRDKLLAQLKIKILTERPVAKVVRTSDKVKIIDASGGSNDFDKVILACHADEALVLLGNVTDQEVRVLKHFPYHTNKVTLHTDDKVMPKTRRAWSSWNYRVEKDSRDQLQTTTIYHMNSLQGVSNRTNYFISVNDYGIVDQSKVIWQTMYRHPIYSVAAQEAQKDLHLLNRFGPVYYCGAYFRYGFHEDGLWAALQCARAIVGEHLWS